MKAKKTPSNPAPRGKKTKDQPLVQDNPDLRTRGVSRESLGWFAARDLRQEPSAMYDLKTYLDKDFSFTFSRPSGEPSRRREAILSNVEYDTFSMPKIWGEPSYTLLKAKITGKGDPDFMTWHGGEELLFALDGRLEYEFFWPDARKAPDGILKVSVSPDASESASSECRAIRILPHVPHRNSVAEGTVATAWMAIRHHSGSTASVEISQSDDEKYSSRLRAGRRQHLKAVKTASEEETLRDGSQGKVELSHLVGGGAKKDNITSFLLTFGLPGRLREARLRAGLSVTQLADMVSTHSQNIWRLERGITNFSLRTLATIADIVRLDLKELGIPLDFYQPPEGSLPDSNYEEFRPYICGFHKKPILMEEDRQEASESVEYKLSNDVEYRPVFWNPDHFEPWLTAQTIDIKKDSAIYLSPKNDPDVKQPIVSTSLGAHGKQSWIVLEGEVVFEGIEHSPNHSGTVTNFLRQRASGQQKLYSTRRFKELLSPDSHPVLHLRNGAAGSIRATLDSKLLRIEHSAVGYCRNGSLPVLNRETLASEANNPKK